MKDLADDTYSLDINMLHRDGALQPSRLSHWQWTRDGEPVGSIGVKAGSDAHLVILRYRVCSGGGEWERVEQPTRITWTACHYGGRRPWFLCPTLGCGRRVGKLYAGGLYFLCRQCCGLAYASQREDVAGRALLKAQKVRHRLGGSTDLGDPFPSKPKRMHRTTYWRLLNTAMDAEERSWRVVGGVL